MSFFFWGEVLGVFFSPVLPTVAKKIESPCYRLALFWDGSFDQKYEHLKTSTILANQPITCAVFSGPRQEAEVILGWWRGGGIAQIAHFSGGGLRYFYISVQPPSCGRWSHFEAFFQLGCGIWTTTSWCLKTEGTNVLPASEKWIPIPKELAKLQNVWCSCLSYSSILLLLMVQISGKLTTWGW